MSKDDFLNLYDSLPESLKVAVLFILQTVATLKE